MLVLNVILYITIIVVKEFRRILSKPSSGAAKPPNKDMLVRNIILDISIIMVKESRVILPKP